MIRKAHKGFTLIEMIVVILAVGIIGSLTATMLFQGADIFVEETNRQGFVSANRSVFWKVMREIHGQNSPTDFTLSDQNSLYLKNGNGVLKEYQTAAPKTFNFKLGVGNYHSMSNSFHYSLSSGFQFYNSSFALITASNGGLSQSEAKTVHLSKLALTFVDDKDTLALSSYIYPENFRFGTKMSFHD